MNTKFKKFGVLLLALVFVFSLAACGNSDEGTDTGSNDSGNDASDDKIVIGFSMDTLQEERWQRDRDFFVEKAEELGAEVLVQSANSDDAKQISQAENLISQGVDVLVVVPHSAKAAAAIVEKAHEAGIKVLSYDRLIKEADVDLYVSFDNERVGEMQATAIVEAAPTGNYVLIEGAETDNNAHLFKQGQMNILQPLVDKGDITIVYEQFTEGWDPANALANMENALTKNENNIDAVVAANDGTAGGVIQALDQQGLAGQIPVSGQDAELAGIQRIVEGTQTMTVYKPIKDLAYNSAQLAIDLANGKTPETDKVVNNDFKDVPSILLDPIPVSQDNIDETVIADGFHSQEDVYGE
ncbi:D-xylose ABC transporter substrate-binding protein [Chengkuizengella sediminis]|uniref:D-xylose ABC transporter substrate-binding protein n=1 Tax=Chengkuizengella sediminis TaxID=1885917 RepID=UPI0013899674|nr:D-xylose ABC transporter substrate-binding protein [Chengkuizengella sediminis]NDI34624.1 D-xylose ABC transporter substrate-binding protein [Chengkuizengella sediminis]